MDFLVHHLEFAKRFILT